MIKGIIDSNETVKPSDRTIGILHQFFSDCFNNEGKFDIERFKTRISENVSIIDEGYELNFLGKSYAQLLASIDTTTVIVPDVAHNSKPENTDSQNIYISGDNMDGLKHLLKSYAGKVKCIYIDPPYNTGSDGFVYNDNFNFTPEELQVKLSIDKEQADKILDLTKRGSASHSAWLMFMMPRLQLAKDLLTEDGVIFISIDDNEQANLKLLCDSVFGEENFLSQIIVQANKRGQTYKQLAKTHEYLLVYARSELTIVNELKKELSKDIKKDGISEFAERELRNRNPKFGRFNRPNLFYPIYVNPDKIDSNGYNPISLKPTEEYSIEVLPYNSEGEESCWRWGAEKVLNNWNDDSDLSTVVAKLKTTGAYGIYEKYRKKTYKAKTIWYDDLLIADEDDDDEIWDDTGVITEQGSVELKNYGMEDAFDFPKPTFLIKRIFTLGTDPEALCVDFFSGSATSADAIMRLNAQYGNRKYILIQLPENLDDKLESVSSSEKAKIQKNINFLESNKYPHTLDFVGMDRIKRAAKKIKDETGADIDYGFKHYTLAEPSDKTLAELENFNPKALFADENLLDEFGRDTVLETWQVNDGYGFGAENTPLVLDTYTAYLMGKHLYMTDPGLTEKDMVALVDKYLGDAAFNPENIVIFGYSFTFTQTEMLRKNLVTLRDGEKNLKINLDIRY